MQKSEVKTNIGKGKWIQKISTHTWHEIKRISKKIAGNKNKIEPWIEPILKMEEKVPELKITCFKWSFRNDVTKQWSQHGKQSTTCGMYSTKTNQNKAKWYHGDGSYKIVLKRNGNKKQTKMWRMNSSRCPVCRFFLRQF